MSVLLHPILPRNETPPIPFEPIGSGLQPQPHITLFHLFCSHYQYDLLSEPASVLFCVVLSEFKIQKLSLVKVTNKATE